MKLTRSMAYTAAQDYGNRHMRKAGRKIWNSEDCNAALVEFNRIWPMSKDVSEAMKDHPLTAAEQRLQTGIAYYQNRQWADAYWAFQEAKSLAFDDPGTAHKAHNWREKALTYLPPLVTIPEQ